MSHELVPLSPPPSAPAVSRPDLIAAWLGGRKPTTVRAYQGDLEHFARWPRRRPPRPRSNT